MLKFGLDIQRQNSNFKNLNKMQKMIFSAVALVAFSFAGMANEIKDKKNEVKSNKKNNKELTTNKKVVGVPCDQCQQWADGKVVGSDPTNAQWMDWVDQCYDDNGCDNLRFRDAKIKHA